MNALVGDFGDSRADRVMSLYNDFATRPVNAQYPRWFYGAWAAASMLPLVKGQRTEAEIAAGRDPDCRPVAIGEVDLYLSVQYYSGAVASPRPASQD